MGISKDAYFHLTQAETYTICEAYLYNKDVAASNFRALFHLQYCQWAKAPKTREFLWPLSHIDQPTNALTMDEIYERNKRIIEQFETSKN